MACDRCVAEWTIRPIHSATPRGVPLIALGRYRGGLRAVILAAKHRGAHGVVRRFGAALREALRPLGEMTVLPMPSSRPGFLARGYGLSMTMARLMGRPIADCLVLEDVGSQRGRTRVERRNRTVRVGNGRPAVGTRVVIVDDVVTTGASVDAAVYACQQAGLRVVGVIAIATALPHPDFAVNAVPVTPVIPQNVSP